MSFKNLMIAAALCLASSAARAADSCTQWSKQSDGTEWRTCVDQNGKQYCEQRSANGQVTRVKCS